jgi:SRSO17 transposase
MRGQVMACLATSDGVLVLAESECTKPSGQCVGSQRITCSPGRLEHRQSGVILAYVGASGHGYLDRDLFLPRAWAEQPALRQATGVPPCVDYCTRPEMARQMLERAIAGEVPHRFVAGGPTFGDDAELRQWLEHRGEAYVLGVCERTALRVTNATTAMLRGPWRHGTPAEGPGIVLGDTDWTGLRIARCVRGGSGRASGDWPTWERWMLVGRPRRISGECEYYLGFARPGAVVEDLVGAIGAHRKVGQGIVDARHTVGLDRFAGRSWDGWYRHMTVALMAHAVLCMARERDSRHWPWAGGRGDGGPSGATASLDGL